VAAPSVDIDVSSVPAGARISVDGTDTGKLTPSPLSFPRVKGKKLVISLHLKGYSMTSFKADLGESSRQTIELVKIKNVEPPVARCKTSERAGCSRDSKGCCVPEGQGSGSGGRTNGSGAKPGSAAAGSADPDGLMKP
jgi:hypothetical protein